MTPFSAKNVGALHKEQKRLTSVEDDVNSVNGMASEPAQTSLKLAKGLWDRLVCSMTGPRRSGRSLATSPYNPRGSINYKVASSRNKYTERRQRLSPNQMPPPKSWGTDRVPSLLEGVCTLGLHRRLAVARMTGGDKTEPTLDNCLTR